MSDPALGLLMLGLIVVVIIMGFPTAFTLMGLGMFFGFFAYYKSGQAWADNHIFDLMVQRTYGAMTNDVLISIPLFVLMGYVMERGALVDKMFYAIQLAFRRVPAALAVASLIVCTFWGIASGLVGAVVVLMGVIAFNPMLKAGYDVKLASGVITAGGTLGILIPPSVMIIVYAAVAGQSVVKLYAAAMFPSFFLAFLYLVYIIGWALLNPKIAPKLSESETRVPVRPWVAQFRNLYSRKMLPALLAATVAPSKALAITVDGARLSYAEILRSLAFVLVPMVLALGTLWSIWWYVVIHQQPDAPTAIERSEAPTPLGQSAPSSAPVEEKLEELGSSVQQSGPARKAAPEVLQQMGNLQSETTAPPSADGPPDGFYLYFAFTAAVLLALLFYYYWIMEAEQFEVLRLLVTSVMPLGILTVVVLAVILFGITTATESAAVGAAGAFLLAFHARTLNWKKTKEAVFLTIEDHLDGVLAVRRLGAVLGGVRDSRRPGVAGELGAVAQSVGGSVHDPVAGDHLRAGLAAGMDRDHRDLRADLPADAEALQCRPDPVGRAGVREPAGGVPVAAGGDVGVLPERRGAEARHAEPDFRRHDALHVHRHHLHGHHVYVAGHDAVAAEVSVRRLRAGHSVRLAPPES